MTGTTQLLNQFFRSTINSYTMVFFSKNRWLGVILLFVSFFDIYAGIAGLLSLLTANAFAWLLGLNRLSIVSGLYGFNALLVGLGLGIAFQPQPQFYLLLVFTALATLFITLAFEGVLGKYGLPYLTLPFLVSLWIAALAARTYSSLIQGESDIYTLNTMYQRGGPIVVSIYHWFGDVDWPIAVKTYFKSLGAIFFQYHLFAGLLVALGLLIYSRIAFLLSIVGFASAWGFYMLIGADMNDLNYGYIGFNHILTAVAIGGFFMVASRWSFLWVILLTPIISIIGSGFTPILQPLQLPLYSLPFNIVVVLFLYGMKFRERMVLKPEAVGIQHFSPEKNLYIGHNSHQRFKGKTLLSLSLPFYGTWKVNQGHNGAHTHKEAWRHAWDFVITDENDREYQGIGNELTDYYCFNMPVIAPADGWIQEVVNNVSDNPLGEVNVAQNWGNTVIIRHYENFYTKLSHLKKGSIKVITGSWVVKGQVLASCGNSGRSPYPHLHFQIQENPHIGSPTLDYPISQYISYAGSRQLKLYEAPVMNEQISNVQNEQALVKAFHFLPGQSLSLSCAENAAFSGTWEVKVDMYKNQYLEDSATKSKAYFHTDSSVFFFSHFEGLHQCTLYYFYLLAYKVPLAFYPDLVVTDKYPPSSFSTSAIRLLQDIIAPFYIFLKPEYRLNYHELTEDLSGNRVMLASECSMKIAGKTRFTYNFSLEIAADKLQTMTISSKSLKARIDFTQS